MSDKKKSKDKKSKKPKKTQQQLDEERKQREAERARRDAERAKKRLTLRAKIATRKKETNKKVPQTPGTKKNVEKEQRKKILRYRRAQSRFAIPKISQDDDMDAIAKANAELQQQIQENEKQSNDNNNNTSFPNTENIENKKDENNNDNDDEKKEDTMDTQSVKSFQSVEELSLSPDQETALNKLQDELEAADPDYYGFVDYTTFINILKSNDVKLTAKQETFMMGALTLIDEGVDYYDFSRKIREVGMTLQPDNTLQDICEEISETVEKEKKATDAVANELPTTDLDKMSSKDIVDVDEEQFEAFFEKAKQYRGRGMSLARMKSASSDVNKQTSLGELIDDLALDGAEVDFALLKTALQTIDCNPPDKDLKYLINHVCQDDSGFVDFNYLVTFLQETSGIPAKKWKNIERIINKVVNQVRMVERAENRKKIQQQKLKERLEKKRNTRLAKQKGGSNEMEDLVKEEKRLRALKLRDKAKGVTK
eukprot:934179_1